MVLLLPRGDWHQRCLSLLRIRSNSSQIHNDWLLPHLDTLLNNLLLNNERVIIWKPLCFDKIIVLVINTLYETRLPLRAALG